MHTSRTPWHTVVSSHRTAWDEANEKSDEYVLAGVEILGELVGDLEPEFGKESELVQYVESLRSIYWDIAVDRAILPEDEDL